MAEAPPRVPGVEARAGKFPGPSLIPALNAIQERVGWLPREELVALSRDVRRPLYEIEGLISFYPHFRTDPPVKAELRVCHDLSCWLRGADERIAAIKERYASDPDVEVVEASCLGRCDIAPACTVNEAPVPLDEADAAELGLADGDLARVSSRRGVIELATKVSHREARGNCFIPFHFREAAANLLTTDEIDPVGKIPEFKFCAVRIEPARIEPARIETADG